MLVRTGLRGLGEVAYSDEGEAYNVVDYSPFPVIVPQEVMIDDTPVAASRLPVPAPVEATPAITLNSTAITGNNLPTSTPLVRAPAPLPAVPIDPAADPSGQLRTQQWFKTIHYADTPAGEALHAHNDAIAVLTDMTDNGASPAQIAAATQKVDQTFLKYNATLEDQNRKNAPPAPAPTRPTCGCPGGSGSGVLDTNGTCVGCAPLPTTAVIPPASSPGYWLLLAAAAYFLLGN